MTYVHPPITKIKYSFLCINHAFRNLGTEAYGIKCLLVFHGRFKQKLPGTNRHVENKPKTVIFKSETHTILFTWKKHVSLPNLEVKFLLIGRNHKEAETKKSLEKIINGQVT